MSVVINRTPQTKDDLYSNYAHLAVTMVTSAPLTTVKYQSVQVDNTSALGLKCPKSAYIAYITVQGANIRYRTDGQDAQTDQGHLVDNGDRIILTGKDQINNFSVISISGTAVLRVTYKK